MSNTATGLKSILDAAPGGTRTYALMDCALEHTTVFPAIKSSGCPHQTLYAQNWQSELSDIAPYLVELTPSAKFSSTLLGWDWYGNWGYFVQATADLSDCAQSLMALTTATLPDKSENFFRFQDPRVLRVFLANASKDNLNTVFAKASRLVVPMEDDGKSSEGAIVYTLDGHALKTTETRFGVQGG